MLYDHPALRIPAIDKSIPCLHHRAVLESKGIDTRVYGNLTKDTDILFVNFPIRAFGEELDKIMTPLKTFKKSLIKINFNFTS